MKAADDVGPPQRSTEVIVPEARRHDRVPGLVNEDQAVEPGSGEPLEMTGEQVCGEVRHGDGTDRRWCLGFLADPFARPQLDQLFGDPDLAGTDVDPAPAQTDELAPPHAGVD